MKKIIYEQVAEKIDNYWNKSHIEVTEIESLKLMAIMHSLVDSINENIESSWKGKKIKFINPVFILGPLKERHSFEEGEIHRCVQDCGESINILIDGEFVEIFKESVYICEEE